MTDSSPEETLDAGSRRPPLRRRTRLVLGGLVTVVVAGAVGVGIAITGDDEPRPTVTRTVAPIRSTERTFALEPTRLASPSPTPPRAALLAIRAAFPGAELVGYVATAPTGTDAGVLRVYRLRSADRTITVTVRPTRPGDREAINRSATTVQIVRQVQRTTVDVLVHRPRRATTSRDFTGVQQLVLDDRLLATP